MPMDFARGADTACARGAVCPAYLQYVQANACSEGPGRDGVQAPGGTPCSTAREWHGQVVSTVPLCGLDV